MSDFSAPPLKKEVYTGNERTECDGREDVRDRRRKTAGSRGEGKGVTAEVGEGVME